jgi:hypothetical protein
LCHHAPRLGDQAPCTQVGLGGGRTKNPEARKIGRRVFLPNLPSVGLLLYKIKHVVDIQPITFPCGMPEDFHPDRHGFRLTSRGEFVVSGPPAETPESVAGRAHWMKIGPDHINREARKHWDDGFGTPLGNSNYHRHTGWQHNHLKVPGAVQSSSAVLCSASLTPSPPGLGVHKEPEEEVDLNCCRNLHNILLLDCLSSLVEL